MVERCLSSHATRTNSTRRSKKSWQVRKTPENQTLMSLVRKLGMCVLRSIDIQRARYVSPPEVGESADKASVSTGQLDNTDESAVKSFFDSLEEGMYSSIVISAADKAVHGAFLHLDTDKVRSSTLA